MFLAFQRQIVIRNRAHVDLKTGAQLDPEGRRCYWELRSLNDCWKQIACHQLIHANELFIIRQASHQARILVTGAYACHSNKKDTPYYFRQVTLHSIQ